MNPTLADATLAASARRHRPHRRYKLVIDEFGGWALFQDLLRVLREVADAHTGTDTEAVPAGGSTATADAPGSGAAPATPTAPSVAAVAIAWVLRQPMVGAVILGARHARHIGTTKQACSLVLTEEDMAKIAASPAPHARGHGRSCGCRAVWWQPGRSGWQPPVLLRPQIGILLRPCALLSFPPFRARAAPLPAPGCHGNGKQVVQGRAKGPSGAFYAMERVRDGKHGTIMRYNLNRLHTAFHLEELQRRIDQLKRRRGVRANRGPRRGRPSLCRGVSSP